VAAQNRPTSRLAASALALLREALKTSYDLFKIMVPISILVKLLQEVGVVEWLGVALGPVMGVVGLPGSMGLVWATAIVTGIYGGIAAFASLAPEAHLTVAQVTVLTTMMLIAHGLPIELQIAQKAGPRFSIMAILRLGGALMIGWGLYQVYVRGGFLQTPHVALSSASLWDWSPPSQNPSWLAWAWGEAKSLLSISLIILALLFLTKLLERLGVTALLTQLLEPVLTALGISKAAAPITIVGMTLGLSFGGGLIIQEAQSGRLEKRDVFFSLALMSLCHSMIEDTLLMTVLGGHQSGILWGRLLFSFLTIFLLVKFLRNVPDETFNRFLFWQSS
jgi:hypothetical protein